MQRIYEPFYIKTMKNKTNTTRMWQCKMIIIIKYENSTEWIEWQKMQQSSLPRTQISTRQKQSTRWLVYFLSRTQATLSNSIQISIHQVKKRRSKSAGKVRGTELSALGRFAWRQVGTVTRKYQLPVCVCVQLRKYLATTHAVDFFRFICNIEFHWWGLAKLRFLQPTKSRSFAFKYF